VGARCAELHASAGPLCAGLVADPRAGLGAVGVALGRCIGGSAGPTYAGAVGADAEPAPFAGAGRVLEGAPLVPEGPAALQAGLLAVGVMAPARAVGETPAGVGSTLADVLAAGLTVGWVTGSLGITDAHELGHRWPVVDRLIAWVLMGSVLYAHFMVEHYRGHHSRAATLDDSATARRGECLWRFLPRTLVGSWRSAWALEAAWLRQRRRRWWASPLAWAVTAQGLGLTLLVSVIRPCSGRLIGAAGARADRPRAGRPDRPCASTRPTHGRCRSTGSTLPVDAASWIPSSTRAACA
jgi:hypothetical protein